MKHPTRKTSQRYVWFGLRVAVSAGLLAVLLSGMRWLQLLQAMGSARAELVFLLLAMLFAERLYAAYRWHVVLRCTCPKTPLGTVVRISFVSTFVGMFLPAGVGTEVLRVYGLTRATSDMALSFASVLIDRSLALLALAMVVLVGFTVAPIGLPYSIGLAAWSCLGALGATCVAIMHPRLRRMLDHLLRSRLLSPLRSRLQELYTRLDLYRDHPKVMVWAALLAIGFQFYRILIALVAALALGLDTPPAYFFVFIPVIILMGMLPISLGGLGVREAGYVYFFGMVGMSSEAALTLSFLITILGMVSTLPGAWFYAVGPRRPEA